MDAEGGRGPLSRGAGTKPCWTLGWAVLLWRARPLGLLGSVTAPGGSEPHRCLLWARTPSLEAAKQQEGGREECESLQSISLQELKLPGGGDEFQESQRGRKSRERDSN